MLTQHTTVPLDISVQTSNGTETSLRDFLGTYLVLYFYPKDDTPGCTIEACNFRDANSELQKMGITLIGVSADSPKSHQKFANKHALGFPLLSDPKKELISAFGVLVEKSIFGKKYMGIERSTFAINPEGTILHVWPKVNPLGHSNAVLGFFRNELKR